MDNVLLPSHGTSNQSLSPLHHDDRHALLVASGKKFMILDGFRPEYAQYYSEVLGVECGQLDVVSFCHSPTF